MRKIWEQVSSDYVGRHVRGRPRHRASQSHIVILDLGGGGQVYRACLCIVWAKYMDLVPLHRASQSHIVNQQGATSKFEMYFAIVAQHLGSQPKHVSNPGYRRLTRI